MKQKKPETQDLKETKKPKFEYKPTSLKSSDFKQGSLVLFNYSPKDDESPYDKNPLVLILKINSKHVLGLNFHWCPLKMREKLVKLLLLKNKNLKENEPFKVDSTLSKEFYRIAKPVFRKYLVNRISKRGYRFKPSEVKEAINLKAEKFIGITAEQAYRLSILKLKGK